MTESLDQVVLNFDKDSLLLLNLCIAFIMFGVALELKPDHFRLLFKTPKPIVIGLISQAILLPAFTFLLVVAINPEPSIALGMILVSACPGGNVSNFYTAMAKGNIALSVSLTAIMSLSAAVLTPLNFSLWGSAYKPAADLLAAVDIDLVSMIKTVIMILAVPLTLGMVFNYHLPKITSKVTFYIKRLSILIFAGFVIIALSANFENFLNHIMTVAILVLLHNALAFTIGYLSASAFKLNEQSKRSVTIETGIQNTGLALVIVFDFFQGIGGMAFIAAWWGIWHLLSGAALSWYWASRL